MEFRQLRYFIGVAEALNFRKAAQRLHISQPPLSRQIRQLEDELGLELFVRNRQRVCLTDGGRLLLPEARALTSRAAQLAELVGRANSGHAGTVKVGVGTALADSVRSVVVEHAKQFPKVDIQYNDIPSALQSKALRTREIDVAFLRPPVDLVYLVSEPLFQEQFMVVLPKASPLAKRKKLQLKALSNQTLLLTPRAKSSTHDKVLEMYRRAGVAPRIVHTTTLAQAAGGILVASGRGIYILPGSVFRRPHFGDDMVAVALDEPSATIEVHIAWRKAERSSVILNFLETARRIFKERAELHKGRIP